MKKLSVLLVLFSSSLFATDFQKITPEALATQIHQQGITKVLNAMPDSGGGEWVYITEHIASGENAWIAIVPMLAKGVDAGFSEDLGTALAQAIPKNVDAVMAVLNDDQNAVSVKSVCSMPLYTETVPEQNAYFVKAVQALFNSKKAPAKKCLDQLIVTVGKSGPFREVD